ncbi:MULTISPECIES: CynX/NimT family MFS transporter [unclassified Sporosarcina]|uniref:MFS transporter n=1 Tax=unclassified Sporosarcina TaxID=2647733 RepID=UPI00204231F2|nr:MULTISPECIES: MFS transporter [unclassified Sporosarcina]GKV65804.1 MFS transporter [Sporosarcina sp. NCCP-2331]GLB55928.1 MFS transporter [Sporosarcina sp. NCCP-2378]
MRSKSTQILLLFAIFAVALNLRPAITSIGPMLDIIREDLTLSNTQVSLLTVIPVICMGAFAMLAPILNKAIGLNKTMYLMLLLLAAATGVRLIVSSFSILLLTALAAGIAIAVIGPLLSALIKQYFPLKVAAVVGIYSFGMGMGATLSAGLTGVFYQKANYHLALAIWAVLAVLGMIAWRVSSKNPIAVKQAIGQTVKKGESPWRSKTAWSFLVFFGLQTALFFSVLTWLVPIAVTNGLTLLQAGTLLSSMTVVQIFMNIGFPIALQRFKTRTPALVGILLIGIVSIGFMWTEQPLLFSIGVLLMGIPLGGLFPICLLMPIDATDTAEETNAWTAMMQTGGFIIGGILPLLVAMLYDYTGNHQVTLFVFLLLFTAMLVLAIKIGRIPGKA